ncbi:acyl carrier protein [Antrihabitans sp. YC3-6]|uniref:Acyl carrier protein n=1 Tax=Antrihabitans stalagmiti TaxID=2799499 RepID=A0A934NMS1_9NOCA|nr:acyl carrier protein [Antrihabitans stalagmiti]MBJ8338098.1 acyl carrier protein [Antrihabitans stalagmiti]
MSETLAGVADIATAFGSATGISRDLRPDDSLTKDLGIDSIASIEMMGLLESRFGVNLIDNPRIVGTETVLQLVDLINDLQTGRVA